ncbi:MAG TPA: hypothetical protein VFQ45_08165 [Longimicrobium sp.]|nr:hypothetical protein [Longimicrobium sp.]
MTTIVLVSGALAGVAFAVRQALRPTCPRCRGRKWDRELVKPLLLCRRCATRIDRQGRVYN